MTLIDAVQKLENFAIRVGDGRAKEYDVTPLFSELEWLYIRQAVSFNNLVTTYKQLNNYSLQHVISLTTVADMTGTRTTQQATLHSTQN